MAASGSLIESTEQSRQSLHLTVRGLPHDSPIPELLNQLCALETVLQWLNQIPIDEVEFTEFESLLQTCGNVCRELQVNIIQAASSGFQDWATMRCKRGSIPDIIHDLKLYTTSILIAGTHIAQ
jgi:Fungal N-terminal domain of STAND proteins